MAHTISMMRGKILPLNKIRGDLALESFPHGGFFSGLRFPAGNPTRGESYSTTQVHVTLDPAAPSPRGQHALRA